MTRTTPGAATATPQRRNAADDDTRDGDLSRQAALPHESAGDLPSLRPIDASRGRPCGYSSQQRGLTRPGGVGHAYSARNRSTIARNSAGFSSLG